MVLLMPAIHKFFLTYFLISQLLIIWYPGTFNQPECRIWGSRHDTTSMTSSYSWYSTVRAYLGVDRWDKLATTRIFKTNTELLFRLSVKQWDLIDGTRSINISVFLPSERSTDPKAPNYALSIRWDPFQIESFDCAIVPLKRSIGLFHSIRSWPFRVFLLMCFQSLRPCPDNLGEWRVPTSRFPTRILTIVSSSLLAKSNDKVWDLLDEGRIIEDRRKDVFHNHPLQQRGQALRGSGRDQSVGCETVHDQRKGYRPPSKPQIRPGCHEARRMGRNMA